MVLTFKACVFRAALGVAIVLATTAATGQEITAFVEPYLDIDVASPEMGTLAFVGVKEGERVEAGQVLAGLDEAVLRAAQEMAESAMQARGRLATAEAELQMHEQRLEKLRALQTRQHASVEEVARAESQCQIAAAQVQAVRDELAVKAAEHRGITAQLEQKRIKAPIDGIVTHVFKDAGEFVSASDPVVLKLVQLDPLLVVFSVPARRARDIRTGSQVPLAVGADHRSATGVVEFVSPTADAQSGTVRVKVRLPNSAGAFQCGDACWLK